MWFLNNDHELNMSMTVLEEKTAEYRIELLCI